MNFRDFRRIIALALTPPVVCSPWRRHQESMVADDPPAGGSPQFARGYRMRRRTTGWIAVIVATPLGLFALEAAPRLKNG